MRRKLYFTLVASFLVSLSMFAQERNCGTMGYLEMQMQQDPGMEQRMAEIEAFTQNRIREYRENPSARMAEIFYVPVVVHIVSNESVAVENISDAQILSQIDVIYKDFRRLNEDATDQWAQAADMEIEFYLAQVDPDGNPTNGITRKTTTNPTIGAYSATDAAIKSTALGGTDAWDPAKYFNFWVGNIGSGILGYAAFPGGPPSQDGIVMSPQFFGSSDYDTNSDFYLQAPFDLGRTTTHEMGHYFNLRHIWGDGGCGVDDFVEDTPESDGSNFGCADTHESCGTLDMVQNYMDYSDDFCMNLFTQGQADRMRATMEPGGPRDQLNQPPFDYQMTLDEATVGVCAPDDAVYTFTYTVLTDFTGATTFSQTGIPAGATAVFSPTSASADATAVTLTVSGLGGVAVGSYPFTIDGASTGDGGSANATLNVNNTTFAATTLMSPADAATDVSGGTTLMWSADVNATGYNVEIATDSGFATIVVNTSSATNSYTTALEPTTQYYWRITPSNDCGVGTASAAFSYTTSAAIPLTCASYTAVDTPIALGTGAGATYQSVISVTDIGAADILDVNVSIDISHTWVSDLNISLISPAGTVVDLSFGNGGFGNDAYTGGTVFDDQATTPITSGSAPFAGSFQPEGSLASLNGESITGDWTLLVVDTAFGDGGNINNFSVELCIGTDTDMDGIADTDDNCPFTANVDQADADGDGDGDVCDNDSDNDGVFDVDDNCPTTPNADQADADGDGIGDVCDIICDMGESTEVVAINDNQTVTSTLEFGPYFDIADVNVTLDISHTWDSDLTIALISPTGTSVTLSAGNGGSGSNYTNTMFDDDAADPIVAGSPPFTGVFSPEQPLSTFNGEDAHGTWTLSVNDNATGDPGTINSWSVEICAIQDINDYDSDNVLNDDDNCVDTFNEDQADADGDGMGDVCDDDDDNDTILDVDDNCPLTANTDQADTDGDGMGDVCDDDIDNDTILNDDDNCDFVVNTDQEDNDGDGMGDVCDDDDDNDGVIDTADNCQFTANADQSDIDGDGIGDVCDPDMDGDGINNQVDNCPVTANSNQQDTDRNGIGDVCDTPTPNDVLTPNGDGINDTWTIVNIQSYPNASISVFNRWGNEVFKTKGYSNDWGGNEGSSGDVLPSGSYYYQLDVDGDGRRVIDGWLLLK